MSQDQLMPEIFDKLLALQEQSHQILASLTDQGIDWDNWLQLFAILAGIGVVVWQVNRQHKSNIEAQNDKIRTELKIQFRNDLEKHIDELTDATAEATVFPLVLQVSVSMALANQQQGVPALPLRQRHVHFTDINAKIGKAAVLLISTIEKHLIVAPELDIFKTAINVALEDMRQTGTVYANDILNILPMDVPPEYQSQRGPIINPPLPNGHRMKIIEKHGDEYRNAVDTLSAWIYDLRVSIQNIALSGLFKGNHLECRQPLATDEIVIKTDPESIRQLQDYFENKTAWGKKKKEAEAWVKNENERKRKEAA